MWWLPLAGSTVWKASNGLLITLSGWARVILTRPASTTLAISSPGHSCSAACTECGIVVCALLVSLLVITS
jgi:hypothetical protein